MKKITLLFSFIVTAFIANAQLTLSGTSYTQNFDALGTGLPTGWGCYISSSSTSIGSLFAFDSNPTDGVFDTANATYCDANVTKHGFKNYPSADVIHATDTCGTQMICPNRALGVRQVGPTTDAGWDSGAAFVLNLAHTTGLSGLSLSFKLQSLDVTSDRLVAWTVDYATGAVPTTFTPATTTGYMTTGGNVFSDTTVTVNFGTALNNISTPVWIRIVTLTFSSLAGSATAGNRPSTAIDDYKLSYTNPTAGITGISSQPALSFGVIGNATPGKITFAYSAEQEGDYQLYIYDIAGRILHTEKVNAVAGIRHIEVNGLNLAPGMYLAKMNNSNSSSVARIMIQ